MTDDRVGCTGCLPAILLSLAAWALILAIAWFILPGQW